MTCLKNGAEINCFMYNVFFFTTGTVTFTY